jgi:hypothetical protein
MKNAFQMYFEMFKKSRNKNQSIDDDILCLHTMFVEKDIFCGPCKKYKNISSKAILEHRKLSFFIHATKYPFFHEILCTNIEYLDVHLYFF